MTTKKTSVYLKTNSSIIVNTILYVGIDVSKDSNQVCILNFNEYIFASFYFSILLFK